MRSARRRASHRYYNSAPVAPKSTRAVVPVFHPISPFLDDKESGDSALWEADYGAFPYPPMVGSQTASGEGQ